MSTPNASTKQAYELDFLVKLNKKIAKECSGFKKQYNRLVKKSSEREITTLSRCPSNDMYIKNVRKQLGIYQRDYKSLRTLLKVNEDKDRRITLVEENQEKERYLKQLIKENERLNKLKYNCSINTDFVKTIEDAEDEAERLKRRIDKAEKGNKASEELIENYTEKCALLMIECSKLSEFCEPEQDLSKEKNENYELLTKKLSSLKINKKTLASKYEYKIKELEKELEVTTKQLHTLNTKVFKKNQQKRLIDMSQADLIIEKYRSKTPYRPDIYHPDVSFMYKPSCKRLYN